MPATPPHLPLQTALLLAGVVVLLSLLLLYQHEAWRPLRRLALIVIGLAAIMFPFWSGTAARHASSQCQLINSLPQLGLRDAGFVSSDSCRACHPGQYASWHRSYHRTMTQPATPKTVLADFGNMRLENRGRSYLLQRRGEEFWVEMADPDWERQQLASGMDPMAAADPPRVWKRVVMTTGSHQQQTYWVSGKDDRHLFNVPFMYLVDDARMVPREDVFLRPPQAGRGYDQWDNNCIECHCVSGEHAIDPAAGSAIPSTAELGIACEACHGPGREHVMANRSPQRRYGIHLAAAGDSTIVHPRRISAQASAQMCGQCHGMNVQKNDALRAGLRYRAGGELTQVKMILRTSDRHLTDTERQDWLRLSRHLQQQPDDFLPSRFWPDGMVRVSGREHNAMIESACFHGGDLSCLSCHSMHESVPDDQLSAGMNGNEACLQCHESYRNDVAAHTHHAADSSGSLCYNCHMPHTAYGLLKAIRSHLIDSPSVQSTLDTGRPNACSLCHLDQPLSFAATHLSEWYGQPAPVLDEESRTISAAVVLALRGDANQRALIAWHMGWAPAEAVSGRNWMAPYLAHLLNDPYSAVRYVAHRSLRRLPGFESFQYDFVGRRDELQRARQRALERWQSLQSRPPDRSDGAVLIDSDGRLQAKKLADLAARRDDRPVDLRE